MSLLLKNRNLSTWADIWLNPLKHVSKPRDLFTAEPLGLNIARLCSLLLE